MSDASFINQSIATIYQIAPNFKPKIGIMLGSGMGTFVEHVDVEAIIPYEELSGFPISTVAGHAGKLVLGHIHGHPVVCMQGRGHYYEGVDSQQIRVSVRTLKRLGCDVLILLGAVGSFRQQICAGELVMISDHINCFFNNPLIGVNDDAFGPRFLPMDNIYDQELRRKMALTAHPLNIRLTESIYLAVHGPCFETPAETRAYRMLGADVVGMSTVPEVIVAHHCQMRILAISTVTNLSTDLSTELITHEGTLHHATLAAPKVIHLVTSFIQKHGHEF